MQATESLPRTEPKDIHGLDPIDYSLSEMVSFGLKFEALSPFRAIVSDQHRKIHGVGYREPRKTQVALVNNNECQALKMIKISNEFLKTIVDIKFGAD